MPPTFQVCVKNLNVWHSISQCHNADTLLPLYLYVSSMPTQHNVWSVEYTKPLTGCIKLSSMKVVATLWQLVAQKEGGWTQRGRPSTVAHRLRIYKLPISKQAREHGDGM